MLKTALDAAPQDASLHAIYAVTFDTGEPEREQHLEIANLLPLADSNERVALGKPLHSLDLPRLAEKQMELARTASKLSAWLYSGVLSHPPTPSASAQAFRTAARNIKTYLLISPSRNEHHTVYAQLLGEMHRFQAAAELAAGDPAKAESEYRKMMALNPSVDLVIEAVTRLEAAGATKAADSLYKARHSLLQEQLDALPDSAFVRNDAAWFMANCNRNVEEAVATATRAVELAPNNAAIRDTLAEAYLRAGKPEEAVRHQTIAVRLAVMAGDDYALLAKRLRQMQESAKQD